VGPVDPVVADPGEGLPGTDGVAEVEVERRDLAVDRGAHGRDARVDDGLAAHGDGDRQEQGGHREEDERGPELDAEEPCEP
jgi:hypothetical protein